MTRGPSKNSAAMTAETSEEWFSNIETEEDFDFGLDEDSTSIVPIFNLEGYIKLTQAVSVGAEVTDIIKLVSGTTRTYAGEYITRSGTASVIVKFFF